MNNGPKTKKDKSRTLVSLTAQCPSMYVCFYQVKKKIDHDGM